MIGTGFHENHFFLPLHCQKGLILVFKIYGRWELCQINKWYSMTRHSGSSHSQWTLLGSWLDRSHHSSRFHCVALQLWIQLKISSSPCCCSSTICFQTSFKYRDRLNTRLREQRPVNLSKSRKSGEQSKQEWYYLKMTIFKKSSFWMFFTLICQRLNLIQNIETFIFKWKFEESIACMRLKKPLQWELRGEVMFK